MFAPHNAATANEQQVAMRSEGQKRIAFARALLKFCIPLGRFARGRWRTMLAKHWLNPLSNE